MLAYQRESTQKKSRNPELSGGIEISKQPKSVSRAIPEPSWNDMRIHYRSNNLPGTDGLATPGAAAMVDLGTAAVADPGTTAVVEPGTTAVAEPEAGAMVDLGTAAVAEPEAGAMVDLGTAAVAEPEAGAMVDLGTAPVVQMLRKRVKGGAAFATTDIYYDKNDNKYYSGMAQEGEGEVTVTQDEYQEFRRISSKGKRIPKTTILAEAHKGADRKFVKDIPKQEEEAVEGQSAGETRASDITVMAQVFSEGSVLAIEPKAVRLYAEGNMRHAVSLVKAFNPQTPNPQAPDPQALDAQALNAQAPNAQAPDPQALDPQAPENSGKYNQFVNMDEQINPEDNDGSTPEVLIKATEYDPLENLQGRYGENSRNETLARVTDQEWLEASFGDNTGDMTREVGAAPGRKYDIIQATFFWIPELTSNQNFTMLKDFMKHQRNKLKDGGKIRVVLSNKDTNYPGREAYNHYRKTADKLTEDVHLKELFTMKEIVFKKNYRNRQGKWISKPQTYADRLNQMGMNSENFQHTRTYGDIEVQAYGDLIIEATKRIVRRRPQMPSSSAARSHRRRAPKG